MKNKSFFWLGICLSPLLIGFWWMLQNKPESAPVVEVPKKSLMSIDFVPSKLKEGIPSKEFLMLSSDAAQPAIKKKLTDFKDKPLIVHFWATWCGACVEEIPELDKFQETYGDNFHVLIVSADEVDGKAVREFYEEKKIKNLSIYIDEKGGLARAMKVAALPTTVFVSVKGKEQGRIIGPVEWMGEAGKLLNSQLAPSK